MNTHAPQREGIGVAPVGPLAYAVQVLLVLFLVVFPKGGIRVGEVPITWGYLLLVAAAVPFGFELLFGSRATVSSARLWSLGALLPFQVVVWLALLTNGVENMGYTISLLASFFVIPPVFLLAFGVYLDRLDLAPLYRLLHASVLVVAAYGIFLFFYRLGTGEFIEIPYLTVNAGDVGGLEGKHIDRDGIFKLISTYNNGNIYGVSLLLLLPLYCWLEPRVSRQAIVKASLLLTLSRTVWIGLIVHEILQRVYVKPVSARAVAVLGVWLAVVVASIGVTLSFLGYDLAFLFDRNLGGRIGQLQALEDAQLLGGRPFETILEMVYVSVLHSFGIAGIATFVVGMAMPLALHFARALPFSGAEYKRSLATGILVYLVVALSDGAILYIPVMAFYWFVASLLLSNNPSFLAWRQPVSLTAAAFPVATLRRPASLTPSPSVRNT